MSNPAQDSASELRAARARWRERTRSTIPADMTIGIVSSFTADAFQPYLGSELLLAGFNPCIVMAPFNQPIQTLMEPTVAFSGITPEFVLLTIRLDDLFPREIADYLGGDEDRQLDIRK